MIYVTQNSNTNIFTGEIYGPLESQVALGSTMPMNWDKILTI